MIRVALLTLVLAGCAASTVPPPSRTSSAGAQRAPQDEVHRGLLTNQKSSPDAPSGEGSGGVGGAGGRGS